MGQAEHGLGSNLSLPVTAKHSGQVLYRLKAHKSQSDLFTHDLKLLQETECIWSGCLGLTSELRVVNLQSEMIKLSKTSLKP